jgi:hypothetical protein
MRRSLRITVAAGLVLAAFSSALFAKDDPDWSTDRVDDAWAEQALANPESDRGWCQSSRSWNDGRVGHREVREFSYPRAGKPLAIDGGENGGMTVMGWDRDRVRVLYRVTAMARTEDRARELAGEVQVELKDGWLRSDGPKITRNDWWSVEFKVWAPRQSNLALTTINGPVGVRDVRGTMDLSTTNGPMSLVDLGGAVEARAENGPLYVALSGSQWDGAGLDAEAQNGPLDLAIPSNYSARLVTGTINGPRNYEYALESTRRSSWNRTTLGKGGPLVRVVTTNGPFHIGER